MHSRIAESVSNEASGNSSTGFLTYSWGLQLARTQSFRLCTNLQETVLIIDVWPHINVMLLLLSIDDKQFCCMCASSLFLSAQEMLHAAAFGEASNASVVIHQRFGPAFQCKMLNALVVL